MVRKSFVFAIAGLLLASASYAKGPEPKLVPWEIGAGSVAQWTRGSGEPEQKGDVKQYGLYLQKLTATSNYSAAGATISGVTSASELQTLGFDIPGQSGVTSFGPASPSNANGYCGAGAPRFDVITSNGTCFLGCTYGDRTQDPTTGWWHISFTSPFSNYTGCSGVSGSIQEIDIVFDEGTDIGAGNVVLDNIKVNNTVIGHPLPN